MKGKDHKAQGRGVTAPLLGQSSLSLSTFARARNNRLAMHEALRVYRTAHVAVAELGSIIRWPFLAA